MKKLFGILFTILFLLQVLPVKQWMCSYVKNNEIFEISDNMEGNQKCNAEKEIIDEIIFQNQSLLLHIHSKINKLNILTSQNAIILHHSEISTPPPDFF